MSLPWHKTMASRANDGRLAAAGSDAVLVLIAAEAQHTTHGHGGVIPPGRLDPRRLRHEANGYLRTVSETRIAAAIAALVQEGLLAEIGDGSWRLCDYGAEAMPSCMHCRKANEDHRFANCPRCRQKMADEVRTKRRAESRATLRDSARVAQRDRTGPDACLLASPSGSVPEQNSEGRSTPVPPPEERARMAKSAVLRLTERLTGGNRGPA